MNIHEKNRTISSTWFEHHPGKTIALIIIASFLVLDVLAANAYKWIAGYPWSKSYQAVERSYRIRSLAYHHDLAKLKSVDNARWGPIRYRVRTNSLGFKDNFMREVPLTSDKRRLVFMGDSFTEGVGLDYDHTFVGIIDSALSSSRIEVLNAAVAGYSPIMYWRKVKYLIEDVGLKFDDLVVFPDLSDALDETRYYLDDNGNVQEYGTKIFKTKDGTGEAVPNLPEGESPLIPGGLPHRLKEWFQDNTIASFTVAELLDLMIVKFAAPKSYAINGELTYWTIDQKLHQALWREGFDRTELSMDKLFDLVEQRHIKLYVAVFPSPDQIYYGDLDSIWVRFWRDWCQKHQVSFLDCFPVLVKGHTKEEREHIIDRYYIRGDVHFNQAGHRLIADAFLDFYRDH